MNRGLLNVNLKR